MRKSLFLKKIDATQGNPMYKKIAKLAILSLAIINTSHAFVIGNNTKVGQVAWQKTGEIYQEIDVQDIPENQSNIIFIRPATNTDTQSSANIALNNRYLTSLQANHFSQTFLCSGEATINVQPTSDKSNDLTSNSVSLHLEPQKTYYFYVDVDSTSNQAILKQIIAENAQMLVTDKKQQNHQISRVVNHCQPYVEPAVPEIVVQEANEPSESEQTADKEELSLRLDIKFDNNKSNIKSEYSTELMKASAFLAQYQHLNVIVEGHTDAKGDDKHNQLLSQRRADAVRFALINQNNLDPARIRAIGYGESRPIADNATEQGREQNRRVVVIAQ